MEIITGGRQSGKTTQAIKLAAAHFAYIVCRSQQEADRIAKIARIMGLDIPTPISYGEFAQRRYHSRGIKGFVIDSLDDFAQYMSDVPVFGGTVDTTEETEGA